ncbi:hypothetical protein [Roseivirga sp. E12]|uniref:TolB family protein n=1 Tax=Roseivirga sp. E12 TaxID=2819237 RepID=UPI001ABD405D|nr:hypothetical protein [Roseivirga sp. E12]MBO3697478.1 hypothetical protein [Roseivirga sp. E12]
MKTIFSLIALVLTTCFALAQAAPPDTDIFLFDLKEKKGKVSLSKGKNITNRKGYDNQPAFFNNDYIVYSAHENGQNDIMIMDLYDNKVTNLTNTKTSEYSPFPMERYNSFATVRVEEDGTQRLWMFPMEGKESPRVIFEKIAPVGYFAWNKDEILMFVLGQPASLVMANPNEVDDKIITSNIGRTIKVVPDSPDFTFERREENGEVMIYRLNSVNKETIPIIKKPESSRDWAITQEGTYITSVGSKLLSYNPKRNQEWVEVMDLGETGAKGITRMAVSANNKRLALVINQ